VHQDEQASARDRAGTASNAQPPRRAVGAARLLAAVGFGLGTAVLAGVIVGPAPAPGAAGSQAAAPAAATATLGGAISEITGMPDTTCCR
jgi:hypothetical protein